MRYAVVIEKGSNSFGSYVPDLPGCVTVGKTRREIEKLIVEAIELHIDGLSESGEAIPMSTSEVRFVEVSSQRTAIQAARRLARLGGTESRLKALRRHRLKPA